MRPSFRLLTALAACAGLTGCLSGIGLGRPEGVLPAGEVAPPPPLAGTAAGRSLAAKTRSDELPAPAPAARSSRALSVPTNVRGAGAISAPSERRIRREDLEDDGSAPSGGGSNLSPSISPSGSVGVGGRF